MESKAASNTTPSFHREECSEFLAATRGREPQGISVDAIRAAADLAASGGSRQAIDIGCGSGNETALMLRSGLRVLAIDLYPESIAATRERVRLDTVPGLAEGLSTQVIGAEHVAMPPAHFALVHARFVLPFLAPEAFANLWPRLLASIAPGGFFAGQLFGPHDSFLTERDPRGMNSHSARDVDRLIKRFDVLHREEAERDGVTALGQSKHWHVHHLVLRRPIVPSTGDQ